MKKIKVILVAILVVTTIVCSTSCGINAGNGTSSQSSSDSQVTDVVEYSTDNDTRVEQMLDRVTIDGKQIKIPFMQSDLPEGYTFDDKVVKMENYYLGDILFNNKKISSMVLSNYKEGDAVNDFVVDSFGYNYLVAEDYPEFIKVDGISSNNSKSDVINKFGEPTSRESTDTGTEAFYYTSSKNENSRITILFNKDGVITTLVVEE